MSRVPARRPAPLPHCTENDCQLRQTEAAEKSAAAFQMIATELRGLRADLRQLKTSAKPNHDAEKTPDAEPDDRDRSRRCRQLRDAGLDVAECRGS